MKKEITKNSLLKKRTAYSITNKILSSFATIPAGLYLGNSIVRGDTTNIIISSITCASILGGAIFAAHMEDKTDKQLQDYIKSQPTRIYTTNDIMSEDYKEIE